MYLLGFGAGLVMGTSWVRRSIRPLGTYVLLQAGALPYGGASLAGLLWALDHVAAFEPLRAYLSGYEPLEVGGLRNALFGWGPAGLGPIPPGSALRVFGLYVIVPAALMLPATSMMGMSFPFLQRAVHDSHEKLGRRVGWLQAGNVFGTTLGAAVTAPVFLNRLGTPTTLAMLVLSSGVFLAIGSRSLPSPRLRRTGFVASVALPALIAGSLPAVPTPGQSCTARRPRAPCSGRMVRESRCSGTNGTTSGPRRWCT